MMVLKKQKIIYSLLIITCILNLILLFRIQTIHSFYRKELNDIKKIEEKFFFNWLENQKMIGTKVIFENHELSEEITSSKLTPLVCIKKKICSSCKDDFISTLNNVISKSNKHIKLVLLDEETKTLGTSYEMFLRSFTDLYFIDSNTFTINKTNNIPDMFMMLIDSQMQISSFYEYQTGSNRQFELYFQSITENFVNQLE